MYWKVVNKDTNTIMACAKWHLYREPGRSECEVSKAASIRDEDIFPEYEPDVYRALFEPLRKAHAKIMGTRPHMYLATLVTHPSYERQGCGRMLLEEGLRMADQHDLDTYLDATLAGKGLYQQYGFEEVRPVPFDLSRWGVNDIVEHSVGITIRYGLDLPAQP